MAITLSSDYIYVLAMLKTTPLVVTVGLSLTIPLAVAGDFLLKRPSRSQVILGAILLVASFIVVGVENSKEGDQGTQVEGTEPSQEAASSMQVISLGRDAHHS
jgi:solute carrier family 35, member F5